MFLKVEGEYHGVVQVEGGHSKARQACKAFDTKTGNAMVAKSPRQAKRFFGGFDLCSKVCCLEDGYQIVNEGVRSIMPACL